ncbi:DUF4230 domain-containing protein [Candidatus Dojkabacteria bacterium]|nr:DUF4230 domain-containing protein [Candidatus Dojkabacteria bacterium]
MQKTMAKVGIYLIVGLVLISGSMVLGGFLYKKFFEKDSVQSVTALSIIERVSTKGILVTKSLYIEEEITIKIDQGSAWSNFWWGHQVVATAPMRIDLGIDLSKLTEDNIAVDNTEKTIIIDFPDVEISSISLDGDIEVERESGIFYKLFEADDNADYNLALTELTNQSRATAEANTELYQETKDAVVELLNFLYSETGYTVSSKQ